MLTTSGSTNTTLGIIKSYTRYTLINNKFFRAFFYLLFELPLMLLYFDGPGYGAFGGWEGREFAEICASLTGVQTDHWHHNMPVCETLIMRRFESFVILYYFIGYAAGVLYFCALACKQCTKRVLKKTK